MKKGVSLSQRVEAALLMANPARGSCRSQSSLRTMEKALSVSPTTQLARSSLVLEFLWYAEPTMRLEPMLLTKALNPRGLARELASGVVVHHQHVRGTRRWSGGT